MCNYLEYHVYDNWDVEMQEFLMEISVVDEKEGYYARNENNSNIDRVSND